MKVVDLEPKKETEIFSNEQICASIDSGHIGTYGGTGHICSNGDSGHISSNKDSIHICDKFYHERVLSTTQNEEYNNERATGFDSLSVDENRKQKCDNMQARHVLAFLAFLGFGISYSLRVNLSVALVAMVNSSTSMEVVGNHSTGDECADRDKNSTVTDKPAEFGWDENWQGLILGSFYYGYILTQVPAGWLASRIGGKRLLGYGNLCLALLTLVTPIAARTSVYLLIVVRVLEGLVQGSIFPAMHTLWGNWAPKLERSKLVGFTYAGAQFGTVITLPLSGLLCDSHLGWPAVFYVFGVLGCVWSVIWLLLTHDTPSSHPRISDCEREYIENSIGKTEVHKIQTPWRSILSSKALLAICAAHFAHNWGYYTLLSCLPSYMKNILKFNIKENGVLSALPYLVSWIIESLSGFPADFVQTRGYLSTKSTRKVFNTAGTVLPGLFVIIVGHVGCNHVLAVIFLTLSIGFAGLNVGGFYVNHLDIAPNFAGALMGITNCVATIPGFVGPAVVGYLTNNNNTRRQWQICFYISGIVSFVGAIIYALFCEGEELKWAKGHNSNNNNSTRDSLLLPMKKSQQRNTSEC